MEEEGKLKMRKIIKVIRWIFTFMGIMSFFTVIIKTNELIETKIFIVVLGFIFTFIGYIPIPECIIKRIIKRRKQQEIFEMEQEFLKQREKKTN